MIRILSKRELLREENNAKQNKKSRFGNRWEYIQGDTAEKEGEEVSEVRDCVVWCLRREKKSFGGTISSILQHDIPLACAWGPPMGLYCAEVTLQTFFFFQNQSTAYRFGR